MRRRHVRWRVPEIPPEIMAIDGTRSEDWRDWCEATGYSIVDLLRESYRRRQVWHGVIAPEDRRW